MNRTDPESSQETGARVAEPAFDAAWVTAARQGDEDAFGELVKMYATRVHAVAYRMMGNEADAREVAQQAWVKAWQKLADYQGGAKFYTWLYRIVMNTALDALRARGRRREVSVYEPGPDGEVTEPRWPGVSDQTPDRELARQEFRRKFDEAMANLSPDHRAALVLREVDGRSYQEIAGILKCRIGTVMSRIFYARRQLQLQLGGILP